MSKILVVLESRVAAGGQPVCTRMSLEALTAARSLGPNWTAVLLGADMAELAAEVATLGGARVLRVEHPLLASYSADGWTRALEQLIRAEQPDYIVFPHSYQTRDFAPAVAVRFAQMLVSDVVAIAAGPVFTRPVYEGRMLAACRLAKATPGFLSVQAGAFAATHETHPAAPVEIFTPKLAAEDLRARAGEPFRAASAEVDLSSAARIVSVGRGIQSEENLPMMRQLADALHAELAASRPVCDAGWVSPDRQVGSSGQTVAPRLYLAIGISGATQHLQGMRTASCIVAINKDPEAPIFEVADYGMVGDLLEVVPALLRALKQNPDFAAGAA